MTVTIYRLCVDGDMEVSIAVTTVSVAAGDVTDCTQ